MRHTLIRKFGRALVGVSLVAGLLVSATALASADTIRPTFAVPAGVNTGQVTVATTPGGFIEVHITGRADALSPDGPLGGGCNVVIGQNVHQQFVRLDATGSGFARFGPFENGDYGVSGKCASRDITATKDLITIPVPDCANCSRIATLVSIDGTPTSQTAGSSSAIGGPSAGCAQAVSAAFASLPPGVEAVAGIIKPALGRVETVLLGACGALSVIGNPNFGSDQNLFESICAAAESALDPLNLGVANDFFCGTPVG